MSTRQSPFCWRALHLLGLRSRNPSQLSSQWLPRPSSHAVSTGQNPHCWPALRLLLLLLLLGAALLPLHVSPLPLTARSFLLIYFQLHRCRSQHRLAKMLQSSLSSASFASPAALVPSSGQGSETSIAIRSSRLFGRKSTRSRDGSALFK